MLTDSAVKASQTSTTETVFVDVALPLPLRQTFTYRLKQKTAGTAGIGARVIVPFGKRLLTGYCIGIHDHIDPETGLDEKKLRDVIEVVDEEPLLTKEILDLTQWAAGYYSSSWGEMLKAALPAGINSLFETVYKKKEPTQEAASLTKKQTDVLAAFGSEPVTLDTLASESEIKNIRPALNSLIELDLVERFHRGRGSLMKPLTRHAARLTDEKAEASNKAQFRLIEFLKNHPEGQTISEIKEQTGVGVSSVKTLEKKGFVEIFEKEISRDPFFGSDLPPVSNHDLTDAQIKALEPVNDAISARTFRAFLIHGVTGSGKTEVYIRAMKSVLSKGRTALMLVPEIALTPVFSKQLRAEFGTDVAIIHSSLSGGERYDEWRRIRSGEARVVIGTRSAVFAPLENIGLIVIDEEHDSSYRQHEMPFYHGRDTAVVRASSANAVILLGSATPSLESYHNSVSGKFELIEMSERVSSKPLAKAELIDMRDPDQIDTRDTVLSKTLADAIEETHECGEQSMILLNRRGFSQFVLCRSCGETIKCRNCEITLTFHRREQHLICHYCSYRQSTPEECPSCESNFLYFLGEGTEQIEDILSTRFPNLKIARVDRDTTRKRRELEKTLERFSSGETDMLVGTQMIAKGHDFPNVTLVGVVSVDAGLSIPDFRSAERTFQLLTQAAGRAGRGERPGRVLIQSFYPEHYALQYAVKQDYAGFYEREIVFRKHMHYPPFVALGLILFKHKNLKTCYRNAEIMSRALKEADIKDQCIVLGPAPAPLSRLKGEYRVHILLKSRNRRALRETIDIALAGAEAMSCDLRLASVEIDPVNLL